MKGILYVLGLISIAGGVVLSLTVIGAAVGIPTVISGFFLLVFHRILDNQEKIMHRQGAINRKLKRYEDQDEVDIPGGGF